MLQHHHANPGELVTMKSCPTRWIRPLLPLCTALILGNLPHSLAEEPGNMTQSDAPAMTITVRQIDGPVMTRTTPDAPWQDLQPGQTLPVGSELRTGLRGSAVLEVGPNAVVSVGRLTHMAIAHLQHDSSADAIRTLLAVRHGSVDFQVNRIGYDNDFRIASPTDVVAVKGTVGSFSCFDGPATVVGDHTNGNDAIFNNTRYSDTNAALTGDQEIQDEDRTPMQRLNHLRDTGRHLTGLVDYSPGNTDGRHGPAGGFDPAGLVNNRDYQEELYSTGDYVDPSLRDRIEDGWIPPTYYPPGQPPGKIIDNPD